MISPIPHLGPEPRSRMSPAILKRLAAIAFNVDAARWPDPTPSAVRLAYRLDVNEFRGERSVQLQVEHVEACGREPAEVA